MLINSTLSIVKELDARYAFTEEVNLSDEISLNRGSFEVIGDALFVLVGNAARHGRPDGTIGVSARRSNDDAGVVVLDIVSESETAELHTQAFDRINAAFKPFK